MSFDDLASQSVIETMSKILGADTWKAINFFDMKTIVREPETFAALLDKVFGYTSIVLQQKKIGETLLGKVGATQLPSSNFGLRQILRLAKAKFPRQALPEPLGP
ncbi:MAG TPA: hypothetical protein VNA15_08765 [Candidatus Angelobacter sp.]|nr:hypothetical protein [Candidatus Angelobacter sp.]